MNFFRMSDGQVNINYAAIMRKMTPFILMLVLFTCSCTEFYFHTIKIKNNTDSPVTVYYTYEYNAIKGDDLSRTMSAGVEHVPSGGSKELDIDGDDVSSVSLTAHYRGWERVYYVGFSFSSSETLDINRDDFASR